MEAGAGFDRRRQVGAPARGAVVGVEGDDVGGVGAEEERPVGDHRRGFEVAPQLAPPQRVPVLGVPCHQFAPEESAVDAPFVIDRRGDEVGHPLVAGPVRHLPKHLAVAQPHRFRVAVLVDHIGDPVGDRGRELDQRVRVDLPDGLQRRIQQPRLGRQVMRPPRHPPEERPVDEPGVASARGHVLAFGRIARAPAADQGEAQRQGQEDQGQDREDEREPSHLAAEATQPRPPAKERRTGIEPASSAWKAEALPLSYRRVEGSLAGPSPDRKMQDPTGSGAVW